MCCGWNVYGQLGLGHTKNILIPIENLNLKSEFITSISCGNNHTMVITSKNTLFVTGSN